MTGVSAPITLIVGLGNPGASYSETRHNLGFRCVTAFCEQHGVVLRAESKFFGRTALSGSVHLLLPETFMNASGCSVHAMSQFYKILPESILIVHDELDLPVGSARLKHGGGHGGHNGLRDIVAALGSGAFYRLRLGIGRPQAGRAVIDHVLSRPSVDEQHRLDAAIERALTVMPLLISGEPHRAMQQLHHDE